MTRQFRNNGATVSFVSVRAVGAVQVEWHPRDALPAASEGWVGFIPTEANLQFPITFSIDYRTVIGRVETQTFRLATVETQPERRD